MRHSPYFEMPSIPGRFRSHSWLFAVAALIGATPRATFGIAVDAPPNKTQPRSKGPLASELGPLIDALGNESYAQRQAATRRIIALGPSVLPDLRARLARETNTEICYRLRYILDNIRPPTRGALILRAYAESGLRPGDIVTHVGPWRISNQEEFRDRLRDFEQGATLRVFGEDGPREVGPVRLGPLSLSGDVRDYVTPQGEIFAAATRLYASGQAERANELLQDAKDIDEREFTRLLRARIAFTAGDGDAAERLMERVERGAANAVPIGGSGNEWSDPSPLDLSGPGKAPFALEWNALTRDAERAVNDLDEPPLRQRDPDLRVQRVLVPAGRFISAATRSAAIWAEDYRDLMRGGGSDRDIIAGNMLAVTAWMFNELDLRSECARMIEPRSAVLRRSNAATATWLRVDTDAWLPFLRGEEAEALSRLFDDAMGVLKRPPSEEDPSAAIRNPRVAAIVAFFVYQFPDADQRREALETFEREGHAALGTYAGWMLFALREGNFDAIRNDLAKLAPAMSDDGAPPFARALAMLEYVREAPDPDVMLSARQRLAQCPPSESRERWLALIDTLSALAGDDLIGAEQALADWSDEPDAAALKTTIAFRRAQAGLDPGGTLYVGGDARLDRPLLAVPATGREGVWVVLGRDRRLYSLDGETGVTREIPAPTPTWFPNPFAWPWIGREEKTGRVWAYGRRRVVEITPGVETPVRLNLTFGQATSFDRIVAPFFSEMTASCSPPDQNEESGEFLRAEVGANHEYVSDPDLPELGVTRSLADNPRFAYASFRGGPTALIDTVGQRVWTSDWLAGRIGAEPPFRFFVRMLTAPDDAAPRALLLTTRGVVILDTIDESVRRLALPGDAPYPVVIPETLPYQRGDQRFAYCVRLPEEGGASYRIDLETGEVEEMGIQNIALPDEWYRSMSRAEIRAMVSAAFEARGLPGVEAFIDDVEATIKEWERSSKP
ncbi:MAG: serine protease [Phycisphaerales bacterium]|nr:serine protease [Phycisphaerales bacterium]